MQEVLIIKLHQYITDHHPDLLVTLAEEGTLGQYLQQQVLCIEPVLRQMEGDGTPAYIVQEHCMDLLIKALGFSRFDFIKALLEDEFEERFTLLEINGITLYEVLNIMQACTPVFEEFNFSEENEDGKWLRYAVTGTIAEYFENSEEGTVRHGIQHT